MNSKLFNFLFLVFVFFGQQVIAHDHIEKFGTAKDAKELLERTVNLVKSNETVAFAMITAGQGGLRNKDLYPFCTTMNGIMIAHPFISGSDMSNFKTSDGVKVADEMLKNAKEGKISKVVEGSCGHYFHKECIENWCKTSTTCPLCGTNDWISKKKN